MNFVRRLLSNGTGLLLVLGGYFLVLQEAFPEGGWAQTILHLGVLFLSGYFLGELGSLARLPRVVCYLAAGILLGGSGLHWVGKNELEDLTSVNDLALGLIAYGAGMHLEWSVLRPKIYLVTLFVGFLPLLVFTGIMGLFFFAGNALLAGFPPAMTQSLPLLLAGVAMSLSPASTIAVIRGMRSKGVFSETVLSIVVAVDLVVIVLFALILARTADGLPHTNYTEASMVAELVVSLGLGGILGWLLNRGGGHGPAMARFWLVVSALALASVTRQTTVYLMVHYQFAFHIEPIIVCLVAGVYLRNASRAPEEFERAITWLSIPVFVVFFAMAGAVMRLDVLADHWPLAGLVFLVRWAGLEAGSRLAAWMGGETPSLRGLYGRAFLPQAGVSILLAMEVSRRIPDWGMEASAVLLAVIAVNELVGPAALQWMLGKAKAVKAA
ncbi:MAG: cation:proton antiporter [Deltaproteobacteria bacterium]|nr:cation:proton antiporter [Deltaproteobacteria bacterium]